MIECLFTCKLLLYIRAMAAFPALISAEVGSCRVALTAWGTFICTDVDWCGFRGVLFTCGTFICTDVDCRLIWWVFRGG